MNECRERIRRERDREKNTYTSPRLALRRVLLLAEGRQFREAAAILSRLGPGVLQSVAAELPIDLLVESLPHSSHMLETLLTRLVSLEVAPRPELPCELVAWRLVGLLGEQAVPRNSAARLASALAVYKPAAREVLDSRRRQLDTAVQGLGTHGLTADSSGALISLHVAMKNELQRHVEVYKQALHKLEELSPVTINQDPASSSHQRLLALSHGDVERRLIDNKSLLTIVDKPALRQLQTLVESLAARVDNDKSVLTCVGQIKRSDPTLDLSDTRPVAGVLMSYSRGCDAVLSLMAEAAPSTHAPRTPPDSCSDGYHSDSDHAPPSPPQAQPLDDRSKLVSRYAGLYTRAADEALPALAALEPLQHSPQLKYKIVFSVVVLSFRAVIGLKERRLSEIRTLLGIDPHVENAPAVTRLSAAAVRVLQDTAHTYPLAEAERTVINQVLSTLREYPCLGSCAALHSLVSSACRVAWLLSVHTPPLRIDTDFSPVVLNPERHTRYSRGSELQKRSDLIRSFVWPALLDGDSCVFRAVVIT